MFSQPVPEALLDKIERFHLVKTELRPADLLFVFGTQHSFDGFLAVISTLWAEGMFKWAVVSGGPIAGEGHTEASVLANGMIALGVPAERIILEETATNTGENVSFSLPLIERRIGLEEVRNLIAVGKDYTSARYLMTLERYWPEVEKMFAPVHLHGCGREGWRSRPNLRKEVLREWAKLGPYLDAGFIAPWPPSTTAADFR
ncbi:YdcF family protein [Caulobacter sp. LARHSG274]